MAQITFYIEIVLSLEQCGVQQLCACIPFLTSYNSHHCHYYDFLQSLNSFLCVFFEFLLL